MRSGYCLKTVSGAALTLLLMTTCPVSLAQQSGSSFRLFPFMERAYNAESSGDWAELQRVTEQVLRRDPTHVEARSLLLEALLNLNNYPVALQVAADLPVDEWRARVFDHAARVAANGNEFAAYLVLERILNLDDDVEAWRSALVYLEQGQHSEQELGLLLRWVSSDEFDLNNALRLATLSVEVGNLNQALQVLEQAAGQPWQADFADALLQRLVASEAFAMASRVLLIQHQQRDLTVEEREQLRNLAMAGRDVTLMANPLLLNAESCLDQVAWLMQYDPDLAAEVLGQCDPQHDQARWAYQAGLLAPALLPPELQPVDPAEQAAAEAEQQRAAAEFAAQEAEFRALERALVDAQRLQDALDAAYRGECDPLPAVDDAGVMTEIRAICLSATHPGAASVYFAQILTVSDHPRYWQRLREAAYNAYEAGDYALALNYWQQLPTDLMNAEDEAALGATEDALALFIDPEVLPLRSLDELRELAKVDPLSHGLELGLRLSGDSDRDRREESIPWLKQAAPRDPYDFRIPESLAYRLYETAEPAGTLKALERAVNTMDPRLAVGEADSLQLQSRHFALRRSYQAQTQRHRIQLANSWARYGVLNVPGARTSDSAFQQLSGELMLGRHPERAGRQLGLYGRVLNSSLVRRDYFHDPAWGIGLRWKPIGQQNLNLYAEWFQPPSGDPDLLLRATGSLLDRGELRDDWRAAENGWHWQSLYLDAAWFVRSEDYQLFGSFTRGYEIRLPTGWPHSVAPYATVQAARSRNFEDVNLGLGLRYRHWFRETDYSAWRNRFDARVEFTHALAGDRKGSDGWRLQLELML